MEDQLLPNFCLTQRTAFKICAEDPAYVLNIAASTANPGIFAASSSTHTIKIYARDSLQLISELRGHTDVVSGISVANTNPHQLWSCSYDKKLVLWDMRSGHIVQHYQTEGLIPLCCDVNSTDTLLGVGHELSGEDASLLLFDTRTTQVTARFTEAHSDDITQVRFSPTEPYLFMSAATDGLVNVFDVRPLLLGSGDLDDCLLHTESTGSSVARVGYFGPSSEFMFGLTHSESIFLWHTLAREGAGSDLISTFGNLRESLVLSGVRVDYFIDCIFDSRTQRLFLIGGTFDGNIEIFHVNKDSISVAASLHGGHTEMIRSVNFDPVTDSFVSCGEDSMLCLWSATARAISPPYHSTVVRSGIEEARPPRMSPY